MIKVFRRFAVILFVAILLVATSGCASGQKSTVASTSYWKRVFGQMGDDMHAFRVDIDRIVFDLDDRPIEEY